MTLFDTLQTFMDRTIAYGMTNAADLAEAARQQGLKTLADVLDDYNAALSAQDFGRAAAAFSLLHIFLIG